MCDTLCFIDAGGMPFRPRRRYMRPGDIAAENPGGDKPISSSAENQPVDQQANRIRDQNLISAQPPAAVATIAAARAQAQAAVTGAQNAYRQGLRTAAAEDAQSVPTWHKVLLFGFFEQAALSATAGNERLWLDSLNPKDLETRLAALDQHAAAADEKARSALSLEDASAASLAASNVQIEARALAAAAAQRSQDIATRMANPDGKSTDYPDV